MSTTTDSPRPLRRDAARNRALLLDAAREVFAARGLEATLDEIAHHAGVGVGTAYRHFANKQELAAAIFKDDFEQLVESARAALDVDDPWQALAGFIETTQQLVTGDVRLRFFKGSCVPVGRRSDYSLYDYGLATYDSDDSFDHAAASGFIGLHGLPSKVWAASRRKVGKEGEV